MESSSERPKPKINKILRHTHAKFTRGAVDQRDADTDRLLKQQVVDGNIANLVGSVKFKFRAVERKKCWLKSLKSWRQ